MDNGPLLARTFSFMWLSRPLAYLDLLLLGHLQIIPLIIDFPPFVPFTSMLAIAFNNPLLLIIWKMQSFRVLWLMNCVHSLNGISCTW